MNDMNMTFLKFLHTLLNVTFGSLEIPFSNWKYVYGWLGFSKQPTRGIFSNPGVMDDRHLGDGVGWWDVLVWLVGV